LLRQPIKYPIQNFLRKIVLYWHFTAEIFGALWRHPVSPAKAGQRLHILVASIEFNNFPPKRSLSLSKYEGAFIMGRSD